MRERPDDALFALAVAEQRILVTENLVDFERLRRDRIAETADVPPLICTSGSAFPLRHQRGGARQLLGAGGLSTTTPPPWRVLALLVHGAPTILPSSRLVLIYSGMIGTPLPAYQSGQ